MRRTLSRLARGGSAPSAAGDVDGRLRTLISTLAVEAAIDVGANRGVYSERLRTDLEFGGRIIALEPDPQMFEALNDRMADDPSFTGLCLAAGAEQGSASLNRVVGAPGLNSLLEPSVSGSERFNAFDTVEQVDVEVRTLDDCVLPLVSEATSLLLKIDTQGFELEVLGGATALLERVSVLQLEVPAIELYRGMADSSQLLDVVRSSGLQLVDIVPGGRDRDDLFLLDFDVIAARRDRLPT